MTLCLEHAMLAMVEFLAGTSRGNLLAEGLIMWPRSCWDLVLLILQAASVYTKKLFWKSLCNHVNLKDMCSKWKWLSELVSLVLQLVRCLFHLLIGFMVNQNWVVMKLFNLPRVYFIYLLLRKHRKGSNTCGFESIWTFLPCMRYLTVREGFVAVEPVVWLICWPIKSMPFESGNVDLIISLIIYQRTTRRVAPYLLIFV